MLGERLSRTHKVDNTPAALPAKTNIRELVLAAIGAERAHVFDAFAGDGVLYRRVWHHAASYVGCDLKWFRNVSVRCRA